MRTITKIKAPKPLYCHGEAYDYFLAQLPQLPTIEGLVRAAIAVSMHALEDVDPTRVEARLKALSNKVRQRARSQTDPAILANMHHVLFDEEGFCGNLQHYYNALNSYLPVVLDTHLGLPIVLSLIYKAVGHWSGLTVEGINAPGHFLVQVKCDQSWMIVDPFFGGQLLSRDEAFERLDRVVGRTLPRLDDLLTTATHEQWLTRIIGNLRQLFANEGRRDDLAAMTELAHALDLAQNPV